MKRYQARMQLLLFLPSSLRLPSNNCLRAR